MTLEQLIVRVGGLDYYVDKSPVLCVTRKTVRYVRIHLSETYETLQYSDGISEYWETEWVTVDTVDIWFHAKTREVINWAYVVK